MAAPNILTAATILGKKIPTLAVTTSAAAVLSNAASSGKLLKIIDLRVTNIDGVNPASITVNAYPQDDIGGTAVAIASAIIVPPLASLILASAENPIFLEEDQSIGALASASGDLVITGSYLDIS